VGPAIVEPLDDDRAPRLRTSKMLIRNVDVREIQVEISFHPSVFQTVMGMLELHHVYHLRVSSIVFQDCVNQFLGFKAPDKLTVDDAVARYVKQSGHVNLPSSQFDTINDTKFLVSTYVSLRAGLPFLLVPAPANQQRLQAPVGWFPSPY